MELSIKSRSDTTFSAVLSEYKQFATILETVLTVEFDLWTRTQINFNSLPNDKILDWSNLKTLQTTNVTKMIISVLDRIENIMGKGEIACTSNFSFSHNVFKRLIFQIFQKVSLCGNGFN